VVGGVDSGCIITKSFSHVVRGSFYNR